MTVSRSASFGKIGAIAAALALTTVGAQAADLPRKAPVYKAPVAVYDWTGFYAGVFAGVGINRSHATDPTGATNGELDYLGAGFHGGVAAGYNWQLAPNWVAGVEADIGYLGLNHNSAQYNDGTLNVNSKANWLGTIRARAGYTTGPTLRYITGGAAFVGTQDTIGVGAASASTSATRSGFTFGSGVETMIGGNWTAKMESLLVDVGKGSAITAGGFTTAADKHQYFVQRFGVNYRFGGKPAPAAAPGQWGGFYAGVLGGGSTNQTKITDPTGARTGEFGNHGIGATLGVLAGYNWQLSPTWVAGLEGDFSWLGINHGVDDYNDSLALFTAKSNWLATLRGRIGYSTGPALLYVTGGAAWLNLRETWDFGAGPGSATKTLSGYALGAGIDSKLSSRWMARTEYLFVGAGKGSTVTQAGGGVPVRGDYDLHVFRSAFIYDLSGLTSAR